MFCINLFVIVKKLQLSPLRFLRHDLRKSKRAKAVHLPHWSFLRRFRLRILFQNLPNYLVLIFGVIFIEVMLCFAFGLPDSLGQYTEKAPDMMFAEYQYVLMGSKDNDGNTIETAEESAERFSMTTLLYPKKKAAIREGMGSGGDESVSVYGMARDSAFIKLGNDVSEKNVYISSAFADKFGLKKGATFTLHAEYENKTYEFIVTGIVNYDGGIAIFMDSDSFNKVFEKEDDDFSGYLSHKEYGMDIPRIHATDGRIFCFLYEAFLNGAVDTLSFGRLFIRIGDRLHKNQTNSHGCGTEKCGIMSIFLSFAEIV